MGEGQPTSQATPSRRKWLRRVTGALSVLSVIAAACAWWFGYVVEEQNYACPLTGAWRTVTIKDGVTVSDRLTNNEISDWASKSGVPGLIPGQAGWKGMSTVTTRGFESPSFGCGRPHMIPYRLHSGSIAATGMTREEALRSYQQYVLNPDPNRHSLFQAMEDWLNQSAD